MVFLCQKAKEVWNKLELYEVINKACVVDHGGEAVLEFLLLMPDQELSLQNAHELIAITAWYLWWDRRTLVHQGKS